MPPRPPLEIGVTVAPVYGPVPLNISVVVSTNGNVPFTGPPPLHTTGTEYAYELDRGTDGTSVWGTGPTGHWYTEFEFSAIAPGSFRLRVWGYDYDGTPEHGLIGGPPASTAYAETFFTVTALEISLSSYLGGFVRVTGDTYGRIKIKAADGSWWKVTWDPTGVPLKLKLEDGTWPVVAYLAPV